MHSLILLIFFCALAADRLPSAIAQSLIWYVLQTAPSPLLLHSASNVTNIRPESTQTKPLSELNRYLFQPKVFEDLKALKVGSISNTVLLSLGMFFFMNFFTQRFNIRFLSCKKISFVYDSSVKSTKQPGRCDMASAQNCTANCQHFTGCSEMLKDKKCGPSTMFIDRCHL